MKHLKWLWQGITACLTAALVLLAVLLVGVRLIGLTPFTVLSGSMAPTYPTGAMLYVRQIPLEAIRVGDPITFVMGADLSVCTHRVVQVNVDGQGDATRYTFITKGDANEWNDAQPVIGENVLGVPVLCVPVLGQVSEALNTDVGRIFFGTLVIVLLILTVLPDVLIAVQKKKSKAPQCG